jgi:hypothetical protein
MDPVKTEVIKVFFDESGKRKTKPNLMGGLSIPAAVYSSSKFETWSQRLRDREISFHWAGYTGFAPMREDIKRLMLLLGQHRKMLKFNVINYDHSILSSRAGSNSYIADRVIYSKFPERLIYGLLRRYGKNTYIEAEICIEDAQEYRDLELNKTLEEQLNVQSLYRGEQYKVSCSSLIPKGHEIGLELTDLLLGFIRTIILNESNTKSNGVHAKNSLIIELLKDSGFFSFMEGIRLFEWTKTRELTEVNFSDYLQLYLAAHHDQYI